MLLKILKLFVFILPTLVFARPAYISPANNPSVYLTTRGIGDNIRVSQEPYLWDINPVGPNEYDIVADVHEGYASENLNDGTIIIDGSPGEPFVLYPINENKFYINTVNDDSSWTVIPTPYGGNIIKLFPHDDSNLYQRFIIRYLP